jgi:hypothetical protein
MGGIGQTYVTWRLTLVSDSHVVVRVLLNVEDHGENGPEKSISMCALARCLTSADV